MILKELMTSIDLYYENDDDVYETFELILVIGTL